VDKRNKDTRRGGRDVKEWFPRKGLILARRPVAERKNFQDPQGEGEKKGIGGLQNPRLERGEMKTW